MNIEWTRMVDFIKISANNSILSYISPASYFTQQKTCNSIVFIKQYHRHRPWLKKGPIFL